MRVREVESEGRYENHERMVLTFNLIAARLAKLQQVAETVENFHNFFGPQLKKVIGDATSIDLMFARVTGLLTPILELTFDVFDNSSEQVESSRLEKK